MEIISRSFYLVCFSLILSGCSLDASIQSLSEVISVFQESKQSTMAVAPSQQDDAKDETNQYRVQSTVGEVTTGESSVIRGSKAYRAEISITYQKM